MALRRLICERFIREPGYRFVELPDPPRARAASDSPAYRQAVADWHAARGLGSGPTPSRPNSNPAASAPSWRGATRRCTTARCGSWTPSRRTSTSTTTSSPASPRSRRSPPDIASRSTTLASRCSSPPARQLREHGLSGSAVVMLDADCSFRGCPPETRIWWGAYLGTPDELLVAGRSARSARRSPNCGPRPGPGTAGSWTPTCCARRLR